MPFPKAPNAPVVYGYVLIDPRDNAVRYVGVTTNPKGRARSHRYASSNKGSGYKSRWVRVLLRAGLAPVFLIIGETSVKSADEAEKWWIEQYRGAGCRLTNATDGGDVKFRQLSPRFATSQARHGKRIALLNKSRIGVSLTEEHRRKVGEAVVGYRHTPESKLKMSEVAKARWEKSEYRERVLVGCRKGGLASRDRIIAMGHSHKGKKLTEEHRKKVSEGVRRAMTPEHCKRMGELRKGKKTYDQTPETKAKISAGLKAYFANHPEARLAQAEKAKRQQAARRASK